MELEYNDNKKRISCIPPGTYIVKKRTSEKYGQHFHITNVPNRDYILIHGCNYSRQLLGCIGVGDAHVDLDKDGLKDITNSKKTLAKLYSIMPDEFKLVTVSVFTPVTDANGNTALTYAISPALPAGLSFNSATGQITGTPTAVSLLTTYTVTITDRAALASSASFKLAVNGAAAWTIGKTASPAYFTSANQTLTFSYPITNTGTVAISGIAVADPKAGGLTCPATTLAAGASMTCTGFQTVTAADATAGSVTSTVTATGTPASGTLSAAIASLTVPYLPSSGWTMTRSTTTSIFSSAGQAMGITYRLSNIGGQAISGIAITDTKGTGITCSATSIPAGGSTLCYGAYITTAADVAARSITGTATATSTSGAAAVSASSTVTYAAPAAMTMTVSANQTSYSTAGTQIGYTFSVTNTGGVWVNGLAVTDTRATGITCATTSIAPGASTTCTGTYTTTAADVATMAALSNTATATGVASSGSVSPATASGSVPFTAGPGWSATVTSNPSSFSALGTAITYTYVVTNTGNVPVTGITGSDTRTGSISCPQTSLAVGASMNCSASYTTTNTDLRAGQALTGVATFRGTPPSGTLANATANSTVSFDAQPGWSISSASASPTSFQTPGQQIAFTFVVSNTGNVSISSVVASAPRIGPVSCLPGPIFVGNFTVCTATYTTTAADAIPGGPIVAELTLTGTPLSGTVAPATASVTVSFTGAPALTVEPTPSPRFFSTIGQSIAYSFLVRNTGNVSVSALSVTDTKVTAVTCPVSTLAPATSTTCTGTYTTTMADAVALSFTNTATATATPAGGVLAPATGQSTVTLNQSSILNTSVAVAPTSFANVGDTLAFTYTLTNAGNTTLSLIRVFDISPGVTCAATTLLPGESTQCNSTYTTRLAEVQAGALVFTPSFSAYVPGYAPPQTPPLQQQMATTTVAMTPVSGLQMTATASPASYPLGGAITYTWRVTNSGNQPVSNMSVVDTLGTAITCPATPLMAGTQTNCTGTYTTSAADFASARTISNSGTVTGTVAQGTAPTATAAAPDVQSNSMHQLIMIVGPWPTVFTGAGQSISYTYSIIRDFSSSGAMTLALSDTRVSAISCPSTSISPGQSLTCTGTIVTTAADVQAGRINSATTLTATGGTIAAANEQATTTVPLQMMPAWTIARSATPTSFTVAGQSIAYSFLLTNTGSAAISSIVVSNSKAGPATCPATSLAVGATMTCTATYTTTVADVQAGTGIADTVTATGTPAQGTLAPATASGTITMTPANSWSGTASMAPATFSAAGQTLTASVVLTNTGNQTITGVRAQIGTWSCPSTTLLGGAAMTCTSTHLTTASDVTSGRFAQSVFFSANGALPVIQVFPAPFSTYVGAPQLTVTATPTPTSFSAASQAVSYTYSVSNSGGVSISGLSATASRATGITCAATTLAAGATTTCAGSYTTTAADVSAAVALGDTVTVNGTPASGTLNPGSATSSVAFVAARLTVATTASPASFSAAGQAINYSFLVANTGSVSISSLAVSDTRATGISCPVTTLAVGANTTCTGSFTTTAANVTAGTALANTVTATGTLASATATGSVAFTAQPAMTLSVSTNPTSFAAAGQSIGYSFLVTNTGNVALSALSVTDTRVASLSCPSNSLAIGASTTCTGSYVTTAADVAGAARLPIRRRRRATPAAGTLANVTAVGSLAFFAQPALTVASTVTPTSFTAAGQNIAYSFRVTNTGNVSISAIAVTDTRATGISCPVTTLAAGANTNCTGSYYDDSR